MILSTFLKDIWLKWLEELMCWMRSLLVATAVARVRTGDGSEREMALRTDGRWHFPHFLNATQVSASWGSVQVSGREFKDIRVWPGHEPEEWDWGLTGKDTSE